MSKTIGIVFNNDYADERVRLHPLYIAFFKQFGNVTIIDPYPHGVFAENLYKKDWTENYLEDIDLLVLPGGPDINPMRYGLPKNPYIGDQAVSLDFFDEYFLPAYIAAGIPVFGICRGFQSLNVHFGGDLKFHVNEEKSFSDGDPVHWVAKPGADFKSKFYSASSNHHQAVRKLGNGLVVDLVGYKMGKAKDGVSVAIKDGKPISLEIEAFHHESLAVAGIQSHPEKDWISDNNKELMKDWTLPTLERLLS